MTYLAAPTHAKYITRQVKWFLPQMLLDQSSFSKLTNIFHSFQSIWDHLVEITKFGRATVIITTHYIDETRQAHQIGLMRGGKLLAEESPSDLLRKYNADSLEDVFLKLSVLQNMGKRRRSSIAKEVIEAVQLPAMTVRVNLHNLTPHVKSSCYPESSLGHVT